MFRPPRGAERPGRGVRTPLSLLGRVGLGVGRVCWVTCGFTVSTSPSTGIMGSANALKCAFCLCPPNLVENSEPRRVVLSPMTSAGQGLQLQGSVEPGLPPAWTRPQRTRPLQPGPDSSVGSTPSRATMRTVRPRSRHEFSFPPFPTSRYLYYLSLL